MEEINKETMPETKRTLKVSRRAMIPIPAVTGRLIIHCVGRNVEES